MTAKKIKPGPKKGVKYSETTRTSFAQRLVEIRKKRNITQYELADKTGITRRAIAAYETVGKNPPPEVLAKLALALNVKTDLLLGIKEINLPESDVEAIPRQLLKRFSIIKNLPPQSQKKIQQLIDMGLSAEKAKLHKVG